MKLNEHITLQASTCAQGIHAGGPGSGCRGPNCGRKKGPRKATKADWKKSAGTVDLSRGRNPRDWENMGRERIYPPFEEDTSDRWSMKGPVSENKPTRDSITRVMRSLGLSRLKSTDKLLNFESNRFSVQVYTNGNTFVQQLSKSGNVTYENMYKSIDKAIKYMKSTK